MKTLSILLGILAFLSFCASILIFVFYPSETVTYGSWIVTLLLILGWGVLNREMLKEALARKSTRYGANLAFIVLLVLGILTFVNILSKDYNWRKDITQKGLNSLSPQTVKILTDLKQDVKVMYFNVADQKERNEALFKNLQYHSKHIQYEFVDTARRPTLTQSMDIRKNDMTVLQLVGSTKQVKVEGSTEEKVANGLMKLLRTKDQVVYFTSGHGERALDEADPLSYGLAKSEMEKSGYTVKELSLLTEGKIPADASAIFIAGPQREFFPKELEILDAWLKKGGRIFAALDLNPAEDGLTKGSRQIAKLLEGFGIQAQDRMLVDPTSRNANVEPQVLLGFAGSREHPITKDFPQSNLANVLAPNFLFPLTTYFRVVAGDGRELTSIARTSQHAWAESDWASLKRGAVGYQEGQDYRGQMDLAVASEVKKDNLTTRIVAFATSTFASNNLISKIGNRDLFLNAAAWLVNDEQFISIRPKEEDDGLKQVNNSALNLVMLISIFFVPLFLIIGGVVVWWRRSKL